MKVKIEFDDDFCEPEVVIKCNKMSEQVEHVLALVSEQIKATSSMVFYKNDEEFYFETENVLFFETGDTALYAHTESDIFKVKYKLTELETLLPRSFIRVSKSAVLNVRKVYSVERSVTSASKVTFSGSNKQTYISRMYYKDFKDRLMQIRG